MKSTVLHLNKTRWSVFGSRVSAKQMILSSQPRAMSYSEDILNDSLFLLGESPIADVAAIQYGPLTMTVAPKVIDS